MLIRSSIILFLTFFFLISIENFTKAEEEAPHETQVSSLNIKAFHCGPVTALQGGGSSFSILGRYTPNYSFGPRGPFSNFSLGGDLGITRFNNSGSSEFWVFEYAAFGAIEFYDRWEARVLAGLQTWTQENANALLVGLEIFYHLKVNAYPWLNNIFVSYSPVFHNITAHLVSAGVGFQF